MNIIQKQIQKLIQKVTLDNLKSGKILNIQSIANLIKDKARSLNGGPTLKVEPFERKKPFPYLSYNKMQEDIVFDIDLLYEQLRDKTDFIFKSYNESSLSYKSQKSVLNAVKEQIDELLITSRNIEDSFYGIIDSFNTLDKINLNRSTPDLVDLTEGAVSLPYNIPSTERLDLSHLSSASSIPVSIRTIDGDNPSSVSIPGSIPGNAFSDILSFWTTQVVSSSDKGCGLEFIFPLSSNNDLKRITRIEIGILPIRTTVITVLTSIDGVNYIRPPQTNDKTVFEETEKMGWDFEEIPARLVKFIINKNQPDSEYSTQTILGKNSIVSSGDRNKWLYSFNISNIAVYKVGRALEGVLYSKPLSIDKEDPVRIISIESEEDLLPNTSIDYAIAICDSNGNESSDYFPINPINRPNSNISNFISLGNSLEDTVFITGGYNTGSYVYQNGINFYSIKSNVTGNYSNISSKLYRGENKWSQQTNKTEEIRSVSNNFIDFSDGSKSKPVYAVTSENGVIYNRAVGNGTTIKTFIGLSEQIIQSNKFKRDDTDPDPYNDPSPDYAIFSVKHLRPRMKIDNQSIAPSSNPVSVNGVSIPIAASWRGLQAGQTSIGVPILLNGQCVDIVSNGVNAPVLKYTNGSFVYYFKEGVDYSIKRSDDPYFNNIDGWNSFPLHWRIVPIETVSITISSGSALTGVYGGTGTFTFTGTNLPPTTLGVFSLNNTENLYIDYYINPDITHRASLVNYISNEIEMDSLIEIGPGDTILVTYRYIPNRVIRETLKLTLNNADSVFEEGIDFVFDPNTSLITRLVGGKLYTFNSCYASFSYKYNVDNLNSYSIWCYSAMKEPYEFVYNSLTLRKELGESFVWRNPSGNIKNVEDLSSMVIDKGWHYFTVKSLDPNVYNDSAFNKAFKLRSSDSKYLFLPIQNGGNIFSKITGQIEPLRRVDFSYLKNSVLKSDHSYFSIYNGNIYINFNPINNSDLVLKEINSLGNIVNKDELFTFKGSRSNTINTGKTYFILRTRLSRSSGSNSGITPKIYSYSIRVGF